VDGTQIGIVPITEALLAAKEKDLDLVEVSPHAEHPVCRIMDYGKIRYAKSKKGKTKTRTSHKTKTRTSHLKEIKLRPLTAEHDVGVKIKNIERSHTDLGLTLLEEITKQVEDIGIVEAVPKMEGKDMSMLIVPK